MRLRTALTIDRHTLILWIATCLALTVTVPGAFGQVIEGALDILEESPDEEDVPVYLEEDNPIVIFDEDRPQIRTAIERAARQLTRRRARGPLATLDEMQNIVSYQYTLKGPTETRIIDEATSRALKAAAGRLYFENHLILGVELLETYLMRNRKRFVARVSIEDGPIPLEDGRIRLSVSISVNLLELYADMDDKRFITTPNLRPKIAIYLDQRNEGISEGVDLGARERMEQTLNRNLFTTLDPRNRRTTYARDLRGDRDLRQDARLDLQRHDMDVLITGWVNVGEARPAEDVYYDRYHFRQAEARVAAYRVDNGMLLAELTDRYSATAETPEAAISGALDVMMQRMAEQLGNEIADYWSQNVLFEPEDYRIMINGIGRGELRQFYSLLRTSAPDVRVHEKAFYGDVAVFNLEWPGLEPIDLETLLMENRYPQFEVQRVRRHHYELDRL